jgi:CheY-like chemotaxis protein
MMWPMVDFEAQLRDALLHLYDPARLMAHPFSAYVEGPTDKVLRQALLDAIEALRPGPATPSDAHAWRTYRLLELRYVGGLSASDALERLGLSKSQYQRDHAAALSALAVLLRGRWRVASAPTPSGVDSGPREALALDETAQLTLHMARSPIDVAATLGELVPLLRPLSEQNSVALSVSLPAELPPVRADRVALRQALLALLGEALGGGATRVALAAESRDGAVIVSIAREGSVVPAAPVRSRLASPDGLAGQPPEWLSPLRGPEAIVARGLVEAMGGALAVESRAETGYWQALLSLPVAARPTLLVVDNSQDFIELIARYLGQTEWRVTGAHDVEHAATAAIAELPAAVLLDVMMPGQDGWDLLLRLKESPTTRSLPVIVCSVLYEPQMARAVGAVDYLTKPISQARLLEALAPWARREPAAVPSA